MKCNSVKAPPGKDAAEAGMTRKEFLASAVPPATSTDFIDEKQLLARLPVSRRTLFDWRASGKIPSIKIGRRVLFCWKNVSDALCRMERNDGN